VTTQHLDLLNWRRRIFALYARIRAEPDSRKAWNLWRRERNQMFRSHPQSPIPPAERDGFEGLTYFEFDPEARVLAHIEPTDPLRFEIPTSDGTGMPFLRTGIGHFSLYGRECTLEVYWLEVYGGGIFISFRDATSGSETYGAGRYLIDTIKGADLGSTDGKLILDFNFAYNPSCSYDSQWVCPLAPPANRLPVAVRAGETTPA
jgi:uncharacterized protein (DUF1684 family)